MKTIVRSICVIFIAIAFLINFLPTVANALELPFQGDVENDNSSGSAFAIKNGGRGSAGSFEITGSNNTAPALQGRTEGAGPAIRARTTGSGAATDSVTTGMGSAGNFRIDNPENQAPALRASTNGSGPAASFDGDVNISGQVSAEAANFYTGSNNTAPALQGRTEGAGPAIRARTTGSGAATDSVTTGMGSAGNFRIDNPENQAPALRASTNGSGPAASFDGDVNISGQVSAEAANFYGDVNISGKLFAESIRNTASSANDRFQIGNERIGALLSLGDIDTGINISLETKQGLVLILFQPRLGRIYQSPGRAEQDPGERGFPCSLKIVRDDNQVVISELLNITETRDFVGADVVEKGTHSYRVYIRYIPTASPSFIVTRQDLRLGISIENYTLKAFEL
ncbi:hypothetical protein SPB21_01485 [Leptothoe sp. ISB3NOV94-8A]